MDFLLLAALVLWSFGACFLPFREKLLRIIVMVNAILVALALVALAVPVFSGEAISVLGGFFVIDTLRALIAVPMAISWTACTAAFVMWWGASFKSGMGTRPLFCLRTITLVGSFAGILLTFLTDSLPVLVAGLLLTFLMATTGILFQVKENVLKNIRKFALGCGAALVFLGGGVAMLLGAGYQQTGKLLLTGSTLQAPSAVGLTPFTMVGIVLTGFAALWFMGLLPGMAWYRKGMASLPKGHRLIMRILLPAALFPHLLTLAAWGGEAGSTFVEKMVLVFSVFAGITAIEYVRTSEGLAETATVFLLSLVLVTIAYGPAGGIPALMIVMMLILAATTLLVSQGAISWNRKTRSYATAVLAGVPVISPLFVPYALSVGYGIQMMPVVACVATLFIIWMTFSISRRLMRAWSEAEGTYADMWGGRIGGVLLACMTLYGCWFLYTDALALIVKSVGA